MKDLYNGKKCRDCIHFSYRGVGVCDAVSLRPDPIEGPSYEFCADAREGEECGQEGKMFEGKTFEQEIQEQINAAIS